MRSRRPNIHRATGLLPARKKGGKPTQIHQDKTKYQRKDNKEIKDERLQPERD